MRKRCLDEQQSRLGATPAHDGGTRFLVWAPQADRLTLRLASTSERLIPMEKEGDYHSVVVDDAPAGSRYFFRFDDGSDLPDPASRSQPEGVHGPSEVISTDYEWQDGGWRGLPLADQIFYELHVGTFSAEGTFEGVISHLDRLRDLGITTIELMPIAQFPGQRNWGYDGVYPYAAQHSYGGPDGLQRLVEACHERGMAIALDVVYNHFGPEGNYVPRFGPYFTDRYQTPWGSAINFDGAGSDEVRRFFIENALYWTTEFHVDVLRLDAVHAISDLSAYPFLRELSEAVRARAALLGRSVQLIAESDLNDPRVLRPAAQSGLGLDAQWSDDFHHALHALITGERSGYYEDFGRVSDLAGAFRRTFVYDHRYSPHRRRHHGAPVEDVNMSSFVVYAQNHDQVGNRMLGERIASMATFEQCKLAAAAVLLSPYIPMLFMGEEYGEKAPFLYFTSHSDQSLIESVREGRRQEFAAFRWAGEPLDPHDAETMSRCRVQPPMHDGNGAMLNAFYRELIATRKRDGFRSPNRQDIEVHSDEERRLLTITRRSGAAQVWLAFNFGDAIVVTPPPGRWKKLLASAEQRWGGTRCEVPPCAGEETAIPLDKHALVVYEAAG